MKFKDMADLAIQFELLKEQEKIRKALETSVPAKELPHVSDEEFKRTLKAWHRQHNIAIALSFAFLVFVLYLGDWS